MTPVKTKLFKTGGSQAVRLPKAFRFEGSEVSIRREGDKVILEPVKTRSGDLWSRIDAIRGEEQLAYPPQAVLEEHDFDRFDG